MSTFRASSYLMLDYSKYKVLYIFDIHGTTFVILGVMAPCLRQICFGYLLQNCKLMKTLQSSLNIKSFTELKPKPS